MKKNTKITTKNESAKNEGGKNTAKASKPTKPAVASTVAKVEAKPAAKARIETKTPAKAATNGKAVLVAKPLQKTNGSAKGGASGSTNGAGVNGEAAKPSGRPMLVQGHVPSTSLTKKGTFVPGKLPTPPVKLPRRKVEQPEPEFVQLQPPVPQVKTSDKAVKNRAGLGQKDLDFFRDLLLQKRRELVGDMSHMEREALRENNANLSNLPVHMADQGTDAYEQEFTLGLVEKDRTLLREINDAMAKIQNGSYGICEGTGNPIGRPRLEAQPWARHSIEFARILEKRKMMFRR